MTHREAHEATTVLYPEWDNGDVLPVTVRIPSLEQHERNEEPLDGVGNWRAVPVRPVY